MSVVHYNPDLVNQSKDLLDQGRSALIKIDSEMQRSFRGMQYAQGFELVNVGALAAAFSRLTWAPHTISEFQDTINGMSKLIVTYGSDLKGRYVFENGKCYVFYNQGGWIDENGVLHQWNGQGVRDMGASGCGPTSAAAILASYGNIEVTPETISDLMPNETSNQGGNFFKIFSQYDLDYDSSIRFGADEERIHTFVQNGGTMLLAFDVLSINEQWDVQRDAGGHYVAILGVDDSKDPPEYIVCDPNLTGAGGDTCIRMTFDEIAASRTHSINCFVAPPGKTVEEILPSDEKDT